MKKKFTFVDVLIVLLIIAVLGGGYYYLTSKNIIKTDVKGNSFGYTLCISNIPKEVADEFNVEDMVYDSTKQIEIGKIDNVKVEPYEDVFTDTVKGQYVYQTVPDKYRVLIHVVSDDAVVTDNSVVVNNYELFYGKTCYIKGNNFACTSVVWGMDIEEAA